MDDFGRNIMSSVALIDRRCAGENNARMLAHKVTHSHLLDPDEEGLSVLCGLLSAYPAVETVHIMVHAGPDGALYLGYNRIDRETIRARHLPQCDEMTIVLNGAVDVAGADLDALCDDFRQFTNAVIINGRYQPAMIANTAIDGIGDFY